MIVGPAATDVYYQRRNETVPRQEEQYYEPEPDYEIEGAVEARSPAQAGKAVILSTKVPSPSQKQNEEGSISAFSDSIKAAALAREKRAQEDERRKWKMEEEEAERKREVEERVKELRLEEERRQQEMKRKRESETRRLGGGGEEETAAGKQKWQRRGKRRK